MMLAGVLLLWSLAVVQSTSVDNKEIEGCTFEIDKPPDLSLVCDITKSNINVVLQAMRQPQFSIISIRIRFEFLHFQFDDEAFNPNLKHLGIDGDMFSISSRTFKGLSKLEELIVNRNFNSDNNFYKWKIAQLGIDGVDTATYPPNINDTSQLFGAGWLAPLTNLQLLRIIRSNISTFRVAEFCTLKQLRIIELSRDRINSTDGLGITCESSVCSPCLPSATHLNISHNPLHDFTLNVSQDLLRLKVLDISYCNLTVLNFGSATSDRMDILDASNNNLNSLLLDEDPCPQMQHPCHRPQVKHPYIRPHLQHLKLQHNQLHNITPNLFSCMPHLQWLRLSGNTLTAETLISAGLNSLTEVKWLELNDNPIGTLQPTLLGNLTELIVLQCNSCSLTNIDPDTFNGMWNLRHLILNNNKLSTIKSATFSYFLLLDILDLSRNALNETHLPKNLITVRTLKLSDNQLSKIPSFSEVQSNLSSLIIDRNQIAGIGPRELSGFIYLKHLSLAFNNIKFVRDYSFANQNILETLVLSSNLIKRIPRFGLHRLPSLIHLSLDNNSLAEFPPLKLFGLEKLMFLNLSGNLIETMEFKYGSSLRGVDLSHNLISELTGFLGYRGQHLQYVNYSYNQLGTLDMKTFITHKLPRTEVYLEGNPLHIDCHSEWLLDTRNTDKQLPIVWNISSALVVKDGALMKVLGKRLRRPDYFVKIADWDLLYGTTAPGDHKAFSDMSRADFVCRYTWFCYHPDCAKDCCNDADTCECSTYCYPGCTCYYSASNDGNNFMNCSSRNMTSLPTQAPSYVRSITLDGNYLTSLNSSGLNFPRLMKLDMANSHISHLKPEAFKNLKMLEILHLQQNNIEILGNQTFAFLSKLQELYLQWNIIHQIDNGSFDDLPQLKVLWLHSNKLKALHVSLFDRMYSLKELTLHGNPWSCDCQSGPALQKWLIRSKIAINNLQIYCNSKLLPEPTYNSQSESSQSNSTNNLVSSLQYLAVIDVDFSICTNRSIVERVYNHTIIETVHVKSITEVVSLATVFVILVIFTLVIHKTRLLLRVWFYNKFGVRFHKEKEDNADKPYDLFIACDKKDERLVLYELLPRLEAAAMSYKVCLECRDWHPGHTTTDAVVASVQLSKRTIVLVTPNHLDTQWCEYSFDAAHHQVLKDKQIRLILVLTDIALEARMTRAMKLYMRTNTFLVIGERWFWKKLRYYLADNPRGADHVVGRDFRLMNAYL